MSADESSSAGGFAHAMIDFFAGVVLIFMLFLVVSSVRLQISESNREARNTLLAELATAVANIGETTVPLVQLGALRLDPVTFASGQATFRAGSEEHVGSIARKLASSLRCLVDEPAPAATMPSGARPACRLA